MDDFRPSGPSSSEAWRAAQRTASVLNYLGIQDAARKRRGTSKTPGAWTGSVVRTSKRGIELTISEKKWKKAKALFLEVMGMIKMDSLTLHCKWLEQIRGYLVHITRTFPATVPYVIGLHLTIDGWRHNRDGDGWRRPRTKTGVKEEKDFGSPGNDVRDGMGVATEDCDLVSYWSSSGRDTFLEGDVDEEAGEMLAGPVEAPPLVRAVPRLIKDMESLLALFRADSPPVRLVQSRQATKFITDWVMRRNPVLELLLNWTAESNSNTGSGALRIRSNLPTGGN
mmetsp:Transcript_23392/g.35469  ORF Transcript_23392/g.35469 Transcript_23392/m.35469 type:complete len:282 (+) Transcript_23392:2867-3712(+)